MPSSKKAQIGSSNNYVTSPSNVPSKSNSINNKLVNMKDLSLKNLVLRFIEVTSQIEKNAKSLKSAFTNAMKSKKYEKIDSDVEMTKSKKLQFSEATPETKSTLKQDNKKLKSNVKKTKSKVNNRTKKGPKLN